MTDKYSGRVNANAELEIQDQNAVRFGIDLGNLSGRMQLPRENVDSVSSCVRHYRLPLERARQCKLVLTRVRGVV